MEQDISHSHLQYVLSNDDKESEEELSLLIADYKQKYDRSYLNDRDQIKYEFLKQLSLDDALDLYDLLCNKAKELYVSIIERFHFHLHGVIEVHNYFKLSDMEPESFLYS